MHVSEFWTHCILWRLQIIDYLLNYYMNLLFRSVFAVGTSNKHQRRCSGSC